ncbi:ankyrin repeat [Chlorella sorokiniana]|uniref:Ankyrin repeat n=1 Tax=Chlorella sorokiniana TaxID=3076 RepID=A0A2P6TVA9_CHLSO|nr:ankyrin repeat [Chlorella sorokiniana]|eukprot:PRW57988.1 ankyrin repeat [Chlorella sorokiniana]
MSSLQETAQSPGAKAGQDCSPASVLQPAGMASADQGSATGSGAASGAASPPAEPAQQQEQAAGSPQGSQASGSAAAPPLSDEALAPLRQLGRQLLQGWAEALATLAKLPGVGSMRVEALAERLQELSREASPAAAAAAEASGSSAGAAGPAAEAAAAAARGSLPAPAPPVNELAGPNSNQKQAYSDPVDMFATAAKSAHLSYPELLHAFAASAEGLDDEALADYLFNLAMLCAEPPENELVVRPVLSLPQNSEEQQQYRRRQAAAAAPVDAILAAMQQQQGGGGPPPPRQLPAQTGLTHEAIWQQIVAQQQQPAGVMHGGGYGGGRLPRGGSGLHHASPVSRSKSDMLSSYQQAQLAEAQGLQGLFRAGSASQQQYQSALQFNPAAAAAMGPSSPLSPSRGLPASGASPLAKAVSAPERDLWMAAASLAAEAEQKQHEAAAAAAAAAAASAEFSFHVQPTSPSFGRLGPLAGSGGSGLLARQYAGPEDSKFRLDTLQSLSPRDYGRFSGLKYTVYTALRLHDLASPAEAAARALEVLSQNSPQRTKELRAVAILLGLDRQALKAKGPALLEACEAVFAQEYRDLEAKKKEGEWRRRCLAQCEHCGPGRYSLLPRRRRPRAASLEDGRPIFLVALGDAERLAQAQAAGTPLSVLCPPRSASSSQLSDPAAPGVGGDAEEPAGREANDEEGSEGSWETASLDSSPAELPPEVPPSPTWASMLGRLAALQAAVSGHPGRHSGRRAGRAGRSGRSGRGEHDHPFDSGSDDDELGSLPRELRGITPLHLAVANCDTACIQVLLKDAEERGGEEGLQALLDAPIRRPDLDGPWEATEGLPALYIALGIADEPTIKMLLQAGASLKSSRGEPALHIAAMAAGEQDWEPWRLKVLLDLAADRLDLNEQSEIDGRSALHLLIDRGELELVEMLLEAGADVHQKTAEADGGHSPLHCAVTAGDIDIVQLVLSHGADVRARNSDNKTPAQLAEEMGDDDLVDLLQQRQRLMRLQSHGRPGAGGRSASLRSNGGVPEDVPEEQACAVCISRPKATILAPCGHRCLCKRCLRALMERERDQRNCPVCREQIESFVVTVYE